MELNIINSITNKLKTGEYNFIKFSHSILPISFPTNVPGRRPGTLGKSKDKDKFENRNYLNKCKKPISYNSPRALPDSPTLCVGEWKKKVNKDCDVLDIIKDKIVIEGIRIILSFILNKLDYPDYIFPRPSDFPSIPPHPLGCGGMIKKDGKWKGTGKNLRLENVVVPAEGREQEEYPPGSTMSKNSFYSFQFNDMSIKNRDLCLYKLKSE